MFEKGYKDRVVVHHMVFDYRDNEGSEEPQPLSWELTPRQQQDIQCAIDAKACENDPVRTAEPIRERATGRLASSPP